MDRYFRNGMHEWDDGVGARRMCSLPAAMLRGAMTEGELWLVGGERAFERLEWPA